jgi:hypothetical protein
MKVQPNVKTAKLRNVQCLLFVVGQILVVVIPLTESKHRQDIQSPPLNTVEPRVEVRHRI